MTRGLVTDLVLGGWRGLHARKLRTALSCLGIAIGIAAAVAVLGISASSRANLLAELGAEGNLLTVSAGQGFDGSPAPHRRGRHRGLRGRGRPARRGAAGRRRRRPRRGPGHRGAGGRVPGRAGGPARARRGAPRRVTLTG
jgi:hypothetical protein